MNKENLAPKTGDVHETRNEWFKDIIHLISTDRDFLNMGIASKETTELYNSLIFGDPTVFLSKMRQSSTQAFIKKLVIDYFSELNESKKQPLKLYLDHNDAQLLVWAIIEDGDEEMEMALYKAEAKANAKNYQYGFHISTTILERSDNIPAPPHYQNVQKNNPVG